MASWVKDMSAIMVVAIKKRTAQMRFFSKKASTYPSNIPLNLEKTQKGREEDGFYVPLDPS